MWENTSSRFSSSLLQEEFRTGAPNGIKRCSFGRRRRRKENKSFSVKSCKDSWLQGSSHVKKYEFIFVWLGGNEGFFGVAKSKNRHLTTTTTLLSFPPFFLPFFPLLFLRCLSEERIFSHICSFPSHYEEKKKKKKNNRDDEK